ncbi:hypothetical protein FG386_000838 [Cryptosporidium ryanae]|uniref:uncharacterized protein n=1 Tax=Cryptosporidium ryanae TaxID=515981 RepID=UPI00351A8342|nr:hypothetical protein FG386_000838 [Cryptosporidium ryanae]
MIFILYDNKIAFSAIILAFIVLFYNIGQGVALQNKVFDVKTNEVIQTIDVGVNSYISDCSFLQSSLLISPIIGKTKPILSELSFEYSNESLRCHHCNNFKLESSDKILNKLFDPQGVLKQSSGILRYGFFNALFSLINEKIKNNSGLKYVIHPTLLNNSLSSSDCVNLLRSSNKHFEISVFSKINTGIFKIICDRVTKNESILEMSLWKNEINGILRSIKEFISLIEKYLYTKKESNLKAGSVLVPKLAVTGSEIKQRYIKLVSQMERIRKKEPLLFGSLIFNKKMAVKISTQYIPNGENLIWKCIEIIKQNNPALMREKYQEEIVKQICRVSMGS